jgi:hypothetical protein
VKCPLCGKGMANMSESGSSSWPTETTRRQEVLYYCEEHGVMNRPTDLKDKADQIARKV